MHVLAWHGGRCCDCCESHIHLKATSILLINRPPIPLQMKLSRCGQRVAFTLDAGSGEESFAAFTRELAGPAAGTLRHLAGLGGVVSLEWAADGRTLLATQPNELGRPWRVVGCDTAAAVADGGGGGLKGRGFAASAAPGATSGSPSGSGGSWVVYEEADERFFVELGRTKDWR